MVARKTTVTRKGQVTIPIDIRRKLGIKEGDRLAVEERDDLIVFRRARSVVEATAGIGSKYRLSKPMTPREEREAFEQGVADEVVESMKLE